MEMRLGHPAEEIKHLERRINDLICAIADPAVWSGGEQSEIAHTLLDVLLNTLDLDLAYVRLKDLVGQSPIEMLRVAQSVSLPTEPQEIRELLNRRLGDDPRKWPEQERVTVGDNEMTVVPVWLGLQGEIGVIVAASRREDFPRQSEKLVLSVAANQVAIGLQASRLLSEQRRVADERVAQKTQELDAANEALQKEAAERRRAEEALRETERESRLILDNIPGLVGLLPATGYVEVVNRQLLDYFGQTLEELRHWGTNGTVHPEDLPHVADVFARSIETGTPYNIVQRFRRSDGVYRWFENRGFPLRDAEGRVTRWCVLLTDIDERKRAEDALLESELDSRLIVDSIPGLIAVFAPGGELEFVNRQIVEYFGKTLEELKRWGNDDTTHPDDLPRIVELFTHAMASGEPFELESRARRFDGVYHWVQSRGYPLRGADGQIVRWYNLIIDIDERKHAEEALAASERNLKLTIDTIPALAWSAGTDGSADFFNQHYLDYLGFTAEEAGGWGWTAAVHADDLNSLAETWDSIRASEATGEAEARLRRHDGEYRWFLFRANPLRDEQGNIVKWYGTNTDITERRLAVERLQAKQDLLELAQKSARAMAFDWYPQQKINTWSPEQEALHGMAPGSFDGTYQSWKKTIYPPDWPVVYKAIEDARATENGEVAAEFRVQWPDGSIHWLLTKGQMFFDDEGKPLRMVGFTSDITTRKLAEEDLRRSEAFLAEAQRLSSIGSFSWRVATDEITWSEQLYRIYELEVGVPVTLELIRTRVHPDDLTLYEKMVEEARQGGDDFEWHYRLMMPDHSIKYLHAVAHATRDHDGELEYIAAVQDVTERRLSEEALGRLRSELAHVSRVATLGALTASIAHEVNQPLAGIITNASTCQRMLGADPPNLDGARETVRRTIRDGHRAADVITRLRALFSRNGDPSEPVDINEATREVIALLQSEFQRSGIILRAELALDLPPVTGDRIQLQQVVLNLLRNAADAMVNIQERPRQLVIRTELDGGDHVRLSVQDAGIGIDPQAADRLFDAFYTTKDDGMGIGLYVSRSIIERHRGRLWAEANEGVGATFSFSIPCVHGD
ncbi:MAG TPA: PAS domain-containing protein [Pyrinomonadaceae bacterium]|jgi:PAS domain S-box-containing protein